VNEKNKPAVSSKKTEKSERLEPVRKIYKGPAVREEVPSKVNPRKMLPEFRIKWA